MFGKRLFALFYPALTLLSAEMPKVDFARDIRPIFQEHCYGCHGPEQQMSGLRLDRRSSAFQIRRGIVIGPGNAPGSRLFLRVSGTTAGMRMPLTGDLTPEQVDLIRNWIDQGADWPDDLAGEKSVPAADPKAARITAALRTGDRVAFDRLIGDSSAINRPGTDGDTPLMYAALYASADSVRKLLDAGADPNLANSAGATPLMWSIDDIDKVRLLLDRGANPDALSEDRRNALEIAIDRRDAAGSALLLLSRGAKLPQEAGSLRMAARDETVLRALIEKGVSAKALDGGLAVAATSGCDACLGLLIPLSEKSAIKNALATVDLGATPARVKRLLELGADPNLWQIGKPLLAWFVTTKTAAADNVDLLLEHGAGANAKSPDGRTALDYALRQGDTPVAAVLRKFGAVEGQPPVMPEVAPDPAPSARAALARSVPLLQRTGVAFLRKSGCVSCHSNNLTAMTIAALRERKVAFDPAIAQSDLKATGDYIAGNRQRYLQGVSIAGGPDTTSYILAGLAAEAFPPTGATDAMARYLRGTQLADGSWRIAANRPPLEANSIEVTALSLRSLQVYAPAPQREAYRQAVRRAAAWLASAEPLSTEDRAFQLLGLSWAGEKADRRGPLAAALVAEQRPDGGWAQLRSLSSDAYATGQALVAIKTAGLLPLRDPAVRRGVKFLLRTQMQDGSWYVRSRAIALQPYFDSGFPYGTDQYISAAATNWAAMALASTI
jgi:ankyrin repeat protein